MEADTNRPAAESISVKHWFGRCGRRAMEFLRCQDGPTTTEYGIILALIVVVSIASVGALGGTVSQIYSNLDGSIGIPSGGGRGGQGYSASF